MTAALSIEQQKALAQRFPSLLCLVLVGSRTGQHASSHSDWDIAFFLGDGDTWQRLAAMESLRAMLAGILDCPINFIDLIDMRAAKLAMKTRIANEGQILYLADHRYWYKFQEQTWREHEYWQWEESHVS